MPPAVRFAVAIQLVVANQPMDDIRDIGSLLRPV